MVVEPQQRHDRKRDLASSATSDWPQRSFPPVEGRCPGQVPVVLRRSVLQAIHRHGQEQRQVEICGVLVGRGYQDAQGPFVYVEGSIRGDHAGSQVAQVTFTAETWNHIYQILDSAWPQSRIIGWYHTHPGFGVFLSEMDLFIQENFFGSPEQVALVYDPASGEEGLFAWQVGQALRTKFLVEPDVTQEALAYAEPDAAPTASGGLTLAELISKVDRLQRRQNRLRMAVGLLWLVVLAWLLAACWLLSQPRTGRGELFPAPPATSEVELRRVEPRSSPWPHRALPSERAFNEPDASSLPTNDWQLGPPSGIVPREPDRVPR